MFAIRKSASLALSSRVSHTIFNQSRSITSFSTTLRICARPAVLPVFQKRFASEAFKENDKIETMSQDDLAPDTTSAAQFDASDIEPIEAKEVPQENPIGSASEASGGGSRSFHMPANAQESKQLYIGNLYFDIAEEDLRREFSRFGTVDSLKIIKDARGMSKGFGYVTFSEQIEATTARDQMDRQNFAGRTLNVQYSLPRNIDQVNRERRALRDNKPGPPTRTLYIGNMSFDLSDQDLSKLFSGIKNVLDVRVAIDRRTGQPRGFAHADFTDVESAEAAYQKLNGKEVYGRPLRCDYSGPSSRVRPRTGLE